MKLFSVFIWLAVAGPIFGTPLPVTDGIIFHFAAAAQKEARQPVGLGPLGSTQPVDVVLDTGPDAVLAFQSVPERRPVFMGDEDAAFVRFDGKDDFLLWNRNSEPARALTLFVLAAPKSNPGNFSALFGATSLGKNDYVAGLNVDFGPIATKELSVVNVESAGSAGMRDLLEPGFFNAAERPFADFHVFTVRTAPGKTEFFLDGFKGGERERSESVIGLNQIGVGARIYSNDPSQPPFAQGYFDGAIAEVLLFDRALSDPEKNSIEQWMLGQTVPLNALLHGAHGHALEQVKDPPVVQMLVPGFTVQELPLRISNINNLRYRHDGKVVALGYDGRIHLLSDTNNDGLEDKDEIFWDQPTLRAPLGMALTPKGDPRGEGVFVASKGKVSLILDKDRDARADEEIIITTGWPELPHGVDTLGLAVDPRDGSIYFGLGCANFVGAYLIDRASGQSRYALDNIHGTIQRISPDFSKRETICTGVRFTCALAFNAQGDLFATDQEGATWLANGNPLDELLHIQRGKHYGFPPRHPKHLPKVIDEPAVSEFPPQHQSTVGMVFNEGVNGGPHFGPDFWKGDAIVCGESRGKIWRTKLVKTPLGYVAQNNLIACLGLLTVDACVTPGGNLLVSCHSGPPDWGTGPAGEGRLFQIRYTGRDVPQPVVAWAAGPDEFRVAFDRPLDPFDWVKAKENVRIEAGQHVSAGDRFEVIRPGYQVVRDQMAMPRRWVDLLGLSFAAESRTMVLRVPRQTEPVNYAITLPAPEKWRQKSPIAQHPQIDLAANLNGIAATVSANGQELGAVLPHPDLFASEAFTRGSIEHERFFALAKSKDATLKLRGLVNSSNPFVPAVQPGSKLDWDMSKDSFASGNFALTADYKSTAVLDESAARLKKIDLVVTNPAPNTNGLFLAKDSLRHPIAPTRLFVPWASEVTNKSGKAFLAEERTDLKGNWLHGRRLFFGELGCATCHTIRGEGIAFGPDLSNLIHRDRESVWQDILHPSATINPDHTGTSVMLKNGSLVQGIARTLTDKKISLLLPAGAAADFDWTEINAVEPMKTSLMPEGFGARLNSEQTEDLLTFLLLNPLEPAVITRPEPPKPAARKLSEVTDVVGSLATSREGSEKPLRILLCAGPKDHGLDEHDYPVWLDRWSRLLRLGDNVMVATSPAFPTTEQLENCDVAVFFNGNPNWDAKKAAALDEFNKRGGGLVLVHFAVNGGPDPAEVAERTGQSFRAGSGFRHGEFDLVFQNKDHPITRGLPTIHFTDETYWNMAGDLGRLDILGTVIEDKAPRPQLWTMQRFNSRIVGCIPGHYIWTFDDPLFRVLLLRSICWAAKLDDVDRLADLSVIGANVANN